MNVVPIKVKIELTSDGKHKYPNFNALSSVAGMDWSYYVDKFGLGWHYDKCCGHKEEKVGSPRGIQYGLLLIPKNFAEEAISSFPDSVQKLTEVECEEFYNTHAHAHEPDEVVDDEALKIFEIKEKNNISLTVEEQAQKAKVFDANDDTPGIRKNKKKKWADYKNIAGVTIVQ